MYGTSFLLDAPTALRNAGHSHGATGLLGRCKESWQLPSWLSLSSELPICWFIQSNHWRWVRCPCCSHEINVSTVFYICVFFLQLFWLMHLCLKKPNPKSWKNTTFSVFPFLRMYCVHNRTLRPLEKKKSVYEFCLFTRPLSKKGESNIHMNK